ncbi:MAG: cupin domain-containing protein [Actinobacteria bacterium]|nr:cupin domain-containing protein [Actinomycetota bacterium]
MHHQTVWFIMVLEGAIELNLDGDKNYRMETGDTAYCNGQRMHCWRNVSGEKSVMLKVLTPPYGLER